MNKIVISLLFGSLLASPSALAKTILKAERYEGKVFHQQAIVIEKGKTTFTRNTSLLCPGDSRDPRGVYIAKDPDYWQDNLVLLKAMEEKLNREPVASFGLRDLASAPQAAASGKWYFFLNGKNLSHHEGIRTWVEGLLKEGCDVGRWEPTPR